MKSMTVSGNRGPAVLTAVLLLIGVPALLQAQVRDWRVHRRGLLHQTVYNTGELGRAYNAGGTVQAGTPSMEYPPNSSMIIDRTNYPGQHNSFGSGIWVAGNRNGIRYADFCGTVSDGSGNPVSVAGVYSNPISIERIENYPLLPNGDLNPAFDPDEAEEIVISKWSTTNVGITVTRTSRAWSYPRYNSFIIYEYEFENTTPDTIIDFFVTFANTFAPSMFGYQRNHGLWAESVYRGQPNDQGGPGDHFGRFDLRRYMTYNHEREGLPDPDFFDTWSQPGDRGGLNSPQAVGLVVLYYDYAHLSTRTQTIQAWTQASDSAGLWDQNDKAKQPFLYRYENGNLPSDAKTRAWMDNTVRRRTPGWGSGSSDSGIFVTQFDPTLWDYWKGRVRPSANLSWWQPVSRGLGFFPYLVAPGEIVRFSVAEVAGYGPGVAGDRVYRDMGGVIRQGEEANVWFSPVASWYDTLQYQYLGSKSYIGSRYLQDHPLPWYVTPGVVSVRDVADRAIEMYTGGSLVKWDTTQYEPLNAPPTGAYNTIPIPVPSPVFRIENTRAAANQIIWGNQVEGFTTPRLRAPFKHYEVLRAPHPLGPWSVIDSVAPGDPRYWEDSVYVVTDVESNLGDFVAYAVVSVDSLGERSGMQVLRHETQAPSVQTLGKVYVVPNPLVVTSGLQGSDPAGEITDRVQFMGLPAKCTIRIFSYAGQLINTIEHDRDTFGHPWYQISRNTQVVASGVYFFVVEDDQGRRSHGKFVVIH